MGKRVGLVVNPIAGMGGKVGLKGSDGRDILDQAVKLGATPEAPRRAVEALREVRPIRDRVELVTYPGEMGEDEALECGFKPVTIGTIEKGHTTSKDTRDAARAMLGMGVDLLLFAGGDGTAKDVFGAVGQRLPVLGIPAGVKMHSAVYAVNPRSAGQLAARFLSGEAEGIELREAEVMDIDELAYREGRITTRLYGYLSVIFERGVVQNAKEGSLPGEGVALDLIASDVINNMSDEVLYLIGAGTTTRAVMEKLELKNTLLGVDAVWRRTLVGSDLNEAQMIELMDGKRTKLVVGIVGRQGYVFGRGNQQISAKVIQQVGRDNILVIATINKILSLAGANLLVDTGSREVDEMLSGYIRVVTGLGQSVAMKVGE